MRIVTFCLLLAFSLKQVTSAPPRYRYKSPIAYHHVPNEAYIPYSAFEKKIEKLKEEEKRRCNKWSLITFVVTTVLFIGGLVFIYYFVRSNLTNYEFCIRRRGDWFGSNYVSFDAFFAYLFESII